MSLTAKIVTGLVVAAAIAGFIWELVNNQRRLNDFRDDVVAMDFMLAVGADENPKWDYSKTETSEMEALVIVGCWLVELERLDGQDQIVLGEVHSAPNWLNVREEIDVTGFEGTLTPQNVLVHLETHREKYPCAS